MLGYAKFMKDLVAKKWMVIFYSTNNMQHISAIDSRSLVEKKEHLEHSLFLVLLGFSSLHELYMI